MIDRDFGRIVNLFDILAVALGGFDAVAAYALVLMHDCRGTLDCGANSVQVVFAHEQNRQLPQRGHVQGFVKGALVVGGIAQKADGDFIAALELDAFADSRCQRERTAHQRIAAHETVLHVEDVHGTAAAFGRTGFLAVQFSHDLFRIGAALDGMHVVAVAGDDVVITGARGFHHAVAAGFLAGVKMQKAADLAFDVGLIATFLKTAVHHHFFQHALFVFQFHAKPFRN